MVDKLKYHLIIDIPIKIHLIPILLIKMESRLHSVMMFSKCSRTLGITLQYYKIRFIKA